MSEEFRNTGSEESVGTLFPSMEGGGSPGDSKDRGQNITGTPLPTADSNPPPSAEQVLGIDERPESTENPLPDSRRSSRAEQRINKLVRRNHEQRNENEALAGQVEQLTSQLGQMQQLLMQQHQSRPTSAPAVTQAPPTPQVDDYGHPVTPAQQSQQSPAPQGLDAATVQRLIQEGINQGLQPIVQSQQQQSRAQQLALQHQRNFAEAAQEFPDLVKQDSEFRKVFNDIYDNSPLRVLPDAPYQIALQTRGVLAEMRSDAQTSRKIAANVHVPTPTATDAPSNQNPVKSPQVQTALDEAKKRLRLGQGTQEDYKLIRLAGIAAADAQGR